MCSLTAGLMGASALFGYHQTVVAADNQAKALRAQADAYEQNAKIEGRRQEQLADNYAKEARDLRNRQRLTQGTQRAQAGSAGIDFSGSQMDLLTSSLQAYSEDQQNLLTNQRNDNYNSRVTQTNYLNAANAKRAEASNVTSSARAQLIPTLLSTASSITGSFGNTSSSAASSGMEFGNATNVWTTNAATKASSGLSSGLKKNYFITNPNTKRYF